MKSWATGIFTGMLRLCLTLAACCLALGCGGGNPIEGSWYGALPVEGAMSCRIRLKKDDKFDFACGAVIGEGKYFADEAHLRLTFDWVAHDDKKLATPAPMEMEIQRTGNDMDLKVPSGHHLKWERRMQ